MKLDVQGWNEHLANTGEHLHVYCNGEDVTDQCYFADEEGGTVSLFSLNANGRKYYDQAVQGVVQEERIGDVVIRAGEPLLSSRPAP